MIMTDINTDKNNKIAIFGGSFDPIHNSHLELIKNLRKRFNKVIVVPGFQTPFKADAKTASASDRLSMLRIALKGISDVIISEYEINRETISYSIDTAKEFFGLGQLYWVIGSEMLVKLCDWKKIDELKNLVTFYIVKRRGFEITNTDKLRERQIKYEIADFECTDTSSSKIKIDIAFGKALDLPRAVNDYISEKGLYTDYKFITDRYSEFHMKRERIEHSYNVALTAVQLAKRFAVNVDKAIIAALLHDIGKYIDDDEMSTLGLINTEPIVPCRHAGIGAQIAEKYFGIEDREILDAIKYHTVGNKEMGKLAKIIFLADYIEPTRNFDGLDEIRKTAETDLDKSIILVLKNTLKYLEGKEIHKDTSDTLNFLLNNQRRQ